MVFAATSASACGTIGGIDVRAIGGGGLLVSGHHLSCVGGDRSRGLGGIVGGARWGHGGAVGLLGGKLVAVGESRSVELYEVSLRPGYARELLQGHVLGVNDTLCTMTAYRREQLLTMSIAQLEAQESPVEVSRHIRRMVDAPHTDRFRSRWRCADGREFDFSRPRPHQKFEIHLCQPAVC